MIVATSTTVTNSGGRSAYVSASITLGAGPAWPSGSGATLTYTLNGITSPVTSARIGPIPNGKSVIIIVTVDTTNMVNANTPYTASLVLSYYRAAVGGAVVDADAIPVTVNITPPVPEITLGGTLAFVSVAGDTSCPSQAMTVQNTGQNPSTLTWSRSISVDAGISGKITTDISSGALAYSASDTINVTFNPTGVSAGTYAGTITVSETIVGGVASKNLSLSAIVVPIYTGALNITVNGITRSASRTSSSPDYYWDRPSGNPPNATGDDYKLRIIFDTNTRAWTVIAYTRQTSSANAYTLLAEAAVSIGTYNPTTGAPTGSANILFRPYGGSGTTPIACSWAP